MRNFLAENKPISRELQRGKSERSKSIKIDDRINKLTSIFHVSVLLLMINFVIALSKQLWIHDAIAEQIHRLRMWGIRAFFCFCPEECGALVGDSF